MAIIAQNNQQQDDQQQQQAGVMPLSQGPQMGQSSGVSSPQSSPQQKKGSGRFTNIQKYIQANQGAGQRAGQKIEQNIQNQAQGVREGIQSQQQQFQNQLQPTKSFYTGTGEGSAQQVYQQALNDPTQFVQNQENVNRFSQLRTGDTSNLSQLNLEQQKIAAQQAQEAAKKAATETGRFELLRQGFNTPRYSTGQARLDQLILQTDPNLKGLEQKAQQIVDPLTGMISSAEQTAGQDIGAIQQAAQQYSGDVKKQLFGQGEDPGLIKAFENKERSEYENMMKNTSDTLKHLRDVFAPEKFNQASGLMEKQGDIVLNQKDADLLKSMGLDINAQRNTMGLDLGQFIGQLDPEDMPSLGATIKADDYNRYKALQTLAGQTGQTFIDPTQIQDVGKFNRDVATQFKIDDFKRRQGEALQSRPFDMELREPTGGNTTGYEATHYAPTVQEALNFINKVNANPEEELGKSFTGAEKYLKTLYGLAPYMRQIRTENMVSTPWAHGVTPGDNLRTEQLPEQVKQYMKDFEAAGKPDLYWWTPKERDVITNRRNAEIQRTNRISDLGASLGISASNTLMNDPYAAARVNAQIAQLPANDPRRAQATELIGLLGG